MSTPKIIIVDDRPERGEMVARLLKEHGAHCAVAAGSPAGESEKERALHLQVTGIISGVGDEVYPGRCIRAAKKIVALVREHDRQANH